MRCAPLSAPFKRQQSTTPTAEVKALRRPSPRRSSRTVQDLRRMASRQEPRQDQRPLQGRLPPLHRKARPAPSSGRARGLSSGGPQTLPTSRGRRSGTTWRRVSRHVSLRRTLCKECPALRSSPPRYLRGFRKQEQYAVTAAHLAAPHPGKSDELRVCIDIPGLNRAASQERLWPSRVGRCEGPPHSYVRMPFGLPSVAAAFQRNLRSVMVG